MIEMVDLGLSVKWAKCNLGAETETEPGNYYNWSETQEAATHVASDGWRVPTRTEFEELLTLPHELIMENSQVIGVLFRGNGNTLLIPSSGEYNLSFRDPENVFAHTSTPDGVAGLSWVFMAEIENRQISYFGVRPNYGEDCKIPIRLIYDPS